MPLAQSCGRTRLIQRNRRVKRKIKREKVSHSPIVNVFTWFRLSFLCEASFYVIERTWHVQLRVLIIFKDDFERQLRLPSPAHTHVSHAGKLGLFQGTRPPDAGRAPHPEPSSREGLCRALLGAPGKPDNGPYLGLKPGWAGAAWEMPSPQGREMMCGGSCTSTAASGPVSTWRANVTKCQQVCNPRNMSVQ